MKKLILSGVMLTTLVAVALAQSTQPATIEAKDKKAIADAVGKESVVAGTVSRSAEVRGKVFINFKGVERDGFYCIILKDREKIEKDLGGDVIKVLEGKAVHVSGKIELFKDRPQIVIADAKQIQIMADEVPATQPAK